MDLDYLYRRRRVSPSRGEDAACDPAQRHPLDETSALTAAARQFERDAWRIGRLCLLD